MFNRKANGEFADKRTITKRVMSAFEYWFLLGIITVCVSVIGGGVLLVEPWIATNNEEVRGRVEKLNMTAVAEAAEVDRLDVKIQQLKDEVLDTLEKCESGGRKETDGIVVLDSNDKGSYGPYQWQRTSYQHYYEKMTGQKISGRDAIIEALQRDKARALASYVIFDTQNGVGKDWVNCARWHGLDAKVELIKELER